MQHNGLVHFEIVEGETHLLVSAHRNLREETQEIVKNYHTEIQAYINENPHFETSLEPVRVGLFKTPAIIKEMASATKKARVGPMAALAGTIAEYVGYQLLKQTPEVIVENGKNVFIKTDFIRRIPVAAGTSPLNNKIAIEIDPTDTPLGICATGEASSSLSFGKADAVVVTSKSAALADAAATAIGNIVKDVADFDKALLFAKKIRGLKGVLIIKGDQLAIRGKIQLSGYPAI